MIMSDSPVAGQVYFINDPIKNNTSSNANNNQAFRHPYIVISNSSSYMTNNNLGYMQVMIISTLKKCNNSQIEWELPIISFDNTVRYIIPYNIHSIKISDVKLKLKACITATEFGSVDDFITLLMDIYKYVNCIGHVDVDDLIARRDRYLAIFEKYRKRLDSSIPAIADCIDEINTINNTERSDKKFDKKNSRQKSKKYGKTHRQYKRNKHIDNEIESESCTEVESVDENFTGSEYETVYTSESESSDSECSEFSDTLNAVRDASKLHSDSERMGKFKGKRVKYFTNDELTFFIDYCNTYGKHQTASTLKIGYKNLDRRISAINAEIIKRKAE